MNDKKISHRILVVDDNPSIHEDFRKILCHTRRVAGGSLANIEEELFGESAPAPVTTGFEMDSAFQGQEALVKVKAAEAEGRPYSLVFMDVRMPPGWDGVETISRIWTEHPQIQVVICTAYSDYSWDEILRKLGESDSLVILKKPFDNVEVLQLAHALTKKWTVTRQANARMADLDEMVRSRTQELLDANHKLEEEIQRRKDMESALRDSEERFHKAFETAAVALTILRADTQSVVDANESFARLVGRDKTELRGRPVREMHLFKQPAVWDGFVQRLEMGDKISNLDLPIQRTDGAVRQTLLCLEPLSLGDEPHLLAALLDVTEQRQLESRLRQSQKMEAIGQLAAGVAHDFNNLLTIIHGHASIQLAKGDLDRNIAKSLEQVKLASERAAALTRQLLAFSRKQVIQCKPLDLNAAVIRMRDMLQRMVGETISLQCHATADSPMVHADESNIEQVLMNLVLNARDAMPNGGDISIKVSAAEVTEAAMHHPEARDGSYVVLTVNDTGCGMDTTTLNRLFEPFFTTKPAGKGTGLGLATVYGIVKQHQGWVEVESTPGSGSVFRVFFPALKEPLDVVTKPDVALPGTQPQGRGETILVVEDEPAVREYITTVLTQNGYAVLEASCGAEAMLVWQNATKKIHLLFTDMVMPNGVSGSVLANRLLQRDRGLKIVYASGYSPEVAAKGQQLQEGLNFLPKPFSQDRLLTVVRQALDSTSKTVQFAQPVAVS